MAGRLAGCAALAFAVVAVAFSGCLEDASGEGLTAEEAPEGPKSLRVGAVRAGDYVRSSEHSEGTYLKYDNDDDKFEAEAYTQDSHAERWVVGPFQATDGWGRAMDAVTYKFRYAYNNPASDEESTSEFSTTYDLASELSLYADFQIHFTSSFGSCNLSGCQSQESVDSLEARIYHRDGEPARWGSLEGQVLKIGRTVTFNRTVNQGAWEAEIYLNYTVLRQETLDGERAFVVEPKTSVVVTKRPPTPPSSGNLPEPSRPPGPPPKSTHLLWYTAKAAVPVKQVHLSPFLFEGRYHWSNRTSVVEEYTPGQEAVPWGSGEALPRATARAGVTRRAANDYFHQATPGLTFSLDEALNQVETDPLLYEYASYMQQHPEALLYRALYYPDPQDNAYTWSFQYGDPEANQELVAEARRTLVAGVVVPQNRAVQLERDGDEESPVDPAAMEGRELVTLGDFLEVHDQVRPDDPEPIVEINLGSRQASWLSYQDQDYSPRVMFYQPEESIQFSLLPVVGDQEFWFAVDSVSGLLNDGALESLNFSLGFGMNDDLWMPLFETQAVAHGLLDGADRFLPGLWTGLETSRRVHEGRSGFSPK